MKIRTKRGYDLSEVASALQKAIRRGDGSTCWLLGGGDVAHRLRVLFMGSPADGECRGLLGYPHSGDQKRCATPTSS
jgi:hypothetical protein